MCVCVCVCIELSYTGGGEEVTLTIPHHCQNSRIEGWFDFGMKEMRGKPSRKLWLERMHIARIWYSFWTIDSTLETGKGNILHCFNESI